MELKHGPGRPRKYGRPSRAVTITLPEDVIARLRSVDADLGRGIVTLVERRTRRSAAVQPAQVANYGRHAVIIVTPLKALKRLPGVELVPIGNGRALISLAAPKSIAQLELALGDVLARGGLGRAEREVLEALAEILQQARRSRGVSVEERTIIILTSRSPRRLS